MRARKPTAPVTGSPASYRTTDLGGKVKKMRENPGMEWKDARREKSIICVIRVRGFPARDIFSLRALRDGLEQCARVVGTPSPPPPPPSFLQVLFFGGKYAENRVVVKKIKE